MTIAREKIFGPLVAILHTENEGHALDIANDHKFGLSSSVFTQGLDRGLQFVQRSASSPV